MSNRSVTGTAPLAWPVLADCGMQKNDGTCFLRSHASYICFTTHRDIPAR